MPHSNVEIWKPVLGFEDYYEVSNKGRVKSLSRKVKSVSHGKVIYRNTGTGILKGGFYGGHKSRYLGVVLCAKGLQQQYMIHRLVAEAFIPNPDNLPEVNHKDENKMNNCVDNLEWCTTRYNLNYGTRNERIGKSNSLSLKGKQSPMKGKHHSQESKDKMRKAKLGKYKGENNPMYGKKLSAERRKQMSDVAKQNLTPERLMLLKENAKKGAKARWNKDAQ